MPSLKQLAAVPLAVLVLSPALLCAQQNPPQPAIIHFKLTYRLLQIGEDGKIANSRSYSTIIGAGGDNAPAKVRTGDKLPIPVRQGSTTEYQYQDIGTDIDTSHPQIHDRRLSLEVTAASSGVAKAAADGLPNVPVFRQTRWESNVVVTLDKPTIIFSSDNVSDTGKTELELTATQIP